MIEELSTGKQSLASTTMIDNVSSIIIFYGMYGYSSLLHHPQYAPPLNVHEIITSINEYDIILPMLCSIEDNHQCMLVMLVVQAVKR